MVTLMAASSADTGTLQHRSGPLHLSQIRNLLLNYRAGGRKQLVKTLYIIERSQGFYAPFTATASGNSSMGGGRPNFKKHSQPEGGSHEPEGLWFYCRVSVRNGGGGTQQQNRETGRRLFTNSDMTTLRNKTGQERAGPSTNNDTNPTVLRRFAYCLLN